MKKNVSGPTDISFSTFAAYVLFIVSEIVIKFIKYWWCIFMMDVTRFEQDIDSFVHSGQKLKVFCSLEMNYTKLCVI